MNFSDLYREMNFSYLASGIGSFESPQAVERALAKAAEGFSLDAGDLQALLSASAAPYIEDMAVLARNLTRQRFGRTMQLYTPLYLSNECRSSCTYCGFSFENKVPRITLSIDRVVQEAEILHKMGIRHILLLTGEDYKRTPVSYIAEAVRAIRPMFPSIGIEVYPLKETDYEDLRQAGVDSLAVYQETYDPKRYREVHLRGVKKRMQFRLDCPDRAGRAGVRSISIGALLGLSDPATEVYFTAVHARYLMKHYWQTQISLSLPRLRFAEGVDSIPDVSDADYVRYFLALRIFLPDAGLILSTRESQSLRDNLAELCITRMSAGSRTDPGGYSGGEEVRQFEIEDTRSVEEVCAMLESKGLEPLMLDWTQAMK